MKSLRHVRPFALVGVGVLLGAPASAGTIQTFGAGSAVTRTDRSASFESITESGIALSDYTEDGLFIGANADSLIGYEVFGGANPSPYVYCLDGGSMGGGDDSWVTIYATDSERIEGIEFLYGNSWTNGGGGWGNNDAWVAWRTLNGNTVVSSGQAGPYGGLYVGGIIGFYDPDGFDTLQVKCNVANQQDPNIQALAMDNLQVQLAIACYPDFTGDGVLDLFDFLAYVNAFNAANPGADCDKNGGLDLFDFLCFVNAFNAGC